MNIILLITLFLLMIIIGGKRGGRVFIGLILNFIILIFLFVFVAIGIHSIFVTLIGCVLISLITLFYINGKQKKTIASFYSILIVLVILLILVLIVTNMTRISGFGYESYEEINMFSYDVNLDFFHISVSLVLIGLIGATIDCSVAISSALNEVYINNPKLSRRELYLSGMNIGSDILGTTTNTLLFAFLGEFITLLIWFKSSNYSFEQFINNKTFVSETIKIVFSAIGCVLVIPITSYVTSKMIYNRKHK